MIDLHIHSTCSDGTFTPKEIVHKVIEKNLYGFSLTDHDTVDGISEILAMNLPKDLKFIPGIEISCDTLHREIHILGYGIDCKNKDFNTTLNDLRDKRMKRNLDMIELFRNYNTETLIQLLHVLIFQEFLWKRASALPGNRLFPNISVKNVNTIFQNHFLIRKTASN